MTSISNIWKQLTSILSNLNNFHSLKVVDRVSETQLQVGENSDWIIWRLRYTPVIIWVISSFELSHSGYVCLTQVAPGGVAAQCGLAAGDAVLQINSTPSDELEHEAAKQEIVHSGDTVDLIVERWVGLLTRSVDTKLIQCSLNQHWVRIA